MKYLGFTISTAVFAAFTMTAAIGGEVLSLRGANELANDSEGFDKRRVVSQEGGFKRSWKLQPPSIPHKITKERINLQENTCMRCHSPENYQKEKAVKVGDTHYVGADGKKSDKLNGRRYFCSLCHTPQVDAKPLVENTFKSGGN